MNILNNKMSNYYYPIEPNKKTIILSSFTILTFLIALIVGAYSVSIGKDEIYPKNFTVSQALAFGSKPVMVVFFVLSFIGMILLTYLRGPGRFKFTRIALLTLMLSFLLSIIWITTFKNEKLHYSFAGVIFVSNLLFVLLTAYIFGEYLKNEKIYKTYIIDITVAVIISAFILINVYGVFEKDEETLIDDEIFASSELITIGATGVIIYFLGFV